MTACIISQLSPLSSTLFLGTVSRQLFSAKGHYSLLQMYAPIYNRAVSMSDQLLSLLLHWMFSVPGSCWHNTVSVAEQHRKSILLFYTFKSVDFSSIQDKSHDACWCSFSARQNNYRIKRISLPAKLGMWQFYREQFQISATVKFVNISQLSTG